MRLPDFTRLTSSLARLPLGFLAVVGIAVGLFWVYARYQQKPVPQTRREPAELPAVRPRNPGKYVRILSIDDGGMRSLLALHCLDYMEKRSGRPASDLFDIMVGTGSGAFVVAALTTPRTDGTPKFSAADLIEEFPKVWAKTLDTPLLHPILSMDGRLAPKYLTRQRQSVIQEFFGEARLGEALTAVILPAFSLTEQVPFLFASDMGKSTASSGGSARSVTEAGDYFLSDAVCAATCNPALFAPSWIADLSGQQKSLMTGAETYASNPSLLALGEALLRFPGQRCVIISLGSGVGAPPPAPDPRTGWSKFGAPEEIVQAASSASQLVTAQILSTIHRFGAGPVAAYVRLDSPLPADALPEDDFSGKNISALKALGKKLITDKTATLDRTADFLGASPEEIR
ncbi:MAG: hypothetical protein D4R65_07820 [Verrucomicrobiaceae bacterium]|nr:MAG: hypothetical protein D4R65_07820 [Verrucomicrobiaceae bacterium]